MTVHVEVVLLASSVVLGLLHIVAASHSASLQRGYRWTASARDGQVAPLTGIAGRMERAQRNFGETFPFFAAAILAALLLGKHGDLTLWGAHLYFWARIAYWALYVLGVPLLRSLVWNVAVTGIGLILLSLFR